MERVSMLMQSNKKKRVPLSLDIGTLRRTAVSYSPGWWASTIGAGGLNGSVRNGKRWVPAAITTEVYQLRETKKQSFISNKDLSFKHRPIPLLQGKVSGY